MTTSIAIIGDRFMESSVFEREILAKCEGEIECRCVDLPWPDEPMEHGYETPGMEGLKEYMGTSEMVLSHLGDSPILVTHLAPVSKRVLESSPKLRMIAVARGGPVNIAMVDARKRGIAVVNAPGRNASAVAEFTVGAMIAQCRNIIKGHDALRKGQYRGDLYRADLIGNELSEMTVGIIGYGFIGSKVVNHLLSFNPRILVCDPYAELSAEHSKAGVEQVELEVLFKNSDIVSLHARVTEETIGMIGREQFTQMKPGSVIVNTARGPLMDYKALYAALQSNQVGGAVLETFAVEPALPDDPLLKHPNVTLTPHIAGASAKTVKTAAEQMAEEIRRFLFREPPLHPC